VKAIDQISHVIGNIAEVQTFAATIARIDDLFKVLGRLDDCLVIR